MNAKVSIIIENKRNLYPKACFELKRLFLVVLAKPGTWRKCACAHARLRKKSDKIAQNNNQNQKNSSRFVLY